MKKITEKGLENAVKSPEVQEAMKELKNSLENCKNHFNSINFWQGLGYFSLTTIFTYTSINFGILNYDSFQVARIAKEIDYMQVAKLFEKFYIGSGILFGAFGTLSIHTCYKGIKSFIEFFKEKNKKIS